ncbi:MAG TPA: septum formation initiator family protein [Geobacteraceae bacterium]|nr:septum formation initiator family protein [Geobacteraceae bacterium]
MQKRMYIIPGLAVAFILYFTVFGERGLLRIYHLNKEKQQVQQRLEAIKGENMKLVREVDALKNDRRYLESIARRDFGMVRKNEIIYQFPPQQKQEEGAK